MEADAESESDALADVAAAVNFGAGVFETKIASSCQALLSLSLFTLSFSCHGQCIEMQCIW